jgi:hypothetical protein
MEFLVKRFFILYFIIEKCLKEQYCLRKQELQ